ncbi:MAG: hypothetical protein ACK6D6_05145 [Planctomyces sp.]
MTPSTQIRVNHFNVTLLWPVLIEDSEPSAATNGRLQRWAQRLGQGADGEFGAWTECRRPYPLPLDPALQKIAQQALCEGRQLQDADLQVAATNQHFQQFVQQARRRDPRLTASELLADYIQQTADEYSEFVYFHPFVRRFLYGDGPQHGKRKQEQEPAEMLVLEKPELADRVIRWEWSSGFAMHMRIRQLQLNLFQHDVGVLALKLDLESPHPDRPLGNPDLYLNDILRFMDHARRAYSPFFYHADGSPPEKNCGKTDFGKWTAGKCPVKVSLSSRANVDAAIADDNMAGSTSSYSDPRTIEAAATFYEPWSLPFWQGLLHPLQPQGVSAFNTARTPACGLKFRQLVDERLPLMAHISVDDPRQISEADWMRLAWLDEPGDSERMEYAPQLSREQFQRVCYDRFWDPTGQSPAQEHIHTTRWLCTGYGFVGVGSGGFFDTVIRSHFRHHYFRLFLIAHFQKASLLAFADKLAMALGKLDEGEYEDPVERAVFEQELRRLEMSMVLFRSRYWFSEVTSQFQGQEMFDMVVRQLGSGELFTSVYEEMHASNGLVSQWGQQEQTHATTRLTVVATVFLVMVPILETLREHIPEGLRAGIIAGSLGLVLIFGVFLADPLNLSARYLGRGRLTGRPGWWEAGNQRAGRKGRWVIPGLAILVSLGIAFCVYKLDGALMRWWNASGHGCQDTHQPAEAARNSGPSQAPSAGPQR